MSKVNYCSEVTAASAGFLVSLTLSSQTEAFKCKKAWKSWLFGILSTVTFAGTNMMIHKLPTQMQNEAGIATTESVLILLPVVMQILNEMAVCKHKKQGTGKTLIQSIDILVCLCLPLVVYSTARSDMFKNKLCGYYAKATTMLPKGHSMSYSPVDLASARQNAETALRNAMNALEK